MNIFNSCLPSSSRAGIQLGEENEQGRTSAFSCCLPFNQGHIRLPNERSTFENYLDPRSPVSIEDLLAEQEQELDNYYDQTDNEDLYLHTNTPKRTSFTIPQQLQEQLINNIPITCETNDDFALEEAEDAQFISNNRISAIIVDESKLSHAHLNGNMGNDLEVDTFTQELVDVSTIPKSHRVFAIRAQDSDNEDDEYDDEYQNREEEEEQIVQREGMNTNEEGVEEEVEEIQEESVNNNNDTKLHNRYSVQDENTKRDSIQSTEVMMDNFSSSRSIQDQVEELTVKTSTLSNSYSNHFPVATLTRVPYQPPPPMKLDTNQTENAPPLPPRRPSVVTTAQNILGDKLDDFTEKLAFIKKNIIMSMDSDDDQTEYSVESSRMDDQPKFREKRPSWDSLMPRFKRNNSTSSFVVSESNAMRKPAKKSLFPSPSSSKSFSRADFDSDHEDSYKFGNDGDEEEEPFDFSKVVAMGKNVRTFGGEVMGNGLRLFNNLSTRIKNTQQDED
ncbi:hypothetical protein K501DRAFT_337784 [Backusella circina FSU 941]|nr:hypothetical protein K501DRAFT_338786 [Backusella circina FSU 941]KAI8876894.1 hypothetical protein K501DRAFT_337784 [Backusella circina FSU 941]